MHEHVTNNLTWPDEVTWWRRNTEAVCDKRGAEVVHLIVEKNPCRIWHEFGAETAGKQINIKTPDFKLVMFPGKWGGLTNGWWCWWQRQHFHPLILQKGVPSRDCLADKTQAHSSSYDVWYHQWSSHEGYWQKNLRSNFGWALRERDLDKWNSEPSICLY